MIQNGSSAAGNTPPVGIPADLDFPHDAHCCCGSVTCVFFGETQAQFDRLDDSLRTAGRLGKALLVRHETYVAEAEAERKQMREDLDRVSGDRDALQTQNIQVIEENKQLLLQLESANSTVLDTEVHVKSLTATLQSAQDEIQRLNALARRTQTLEAELERFELEQARLRTSLSDKTEDERAAQLRWQKAERSLAAMEEHIQAIESQAKAERDNHNEIVTRLERRRQLEKDLDTAAGRLKGAAAAKSNQENSVVVSHFVKDILQDNANLQMNIVELRELLGSANEQVDSLRAQLSDDPTLDFSSSSISQISRQPSLEHELQTQDSKRNSAQEVHVHHHYHAPPPKADASRRHSQNLRKPRKRRTGVSFSHSSPTHGHSANLSVSTMHSFGSASTHTAMAMHSSPSAPSPNHRWSMHSTAALSSVPSSPRSSLFDRPFDTTDLDSSRPSTPNTDIGDSSFAAVYTKPPVGIGIFETLEEVDSPEKPSSPVKETAARADSPSSSMHDDDEQDPEHSLVDFSRPVPHLPRDPRRPKSFTEDDLPSAPPLTRSASHESLLSVSGMDIHTLRSRPSQLLTGRALSTAAATPATATAALAGPSAPAGLTRKVGTWFGRWGSSPLNPNSTPTKSPAAVAAVAASPARKEVRPVPVPRRPGINQPGAIWAIADPGTRLGGRRFAWTSGTGSGSGPAMMTTTTTETTTMAETMQSYGKEMRPRDKKPVLGMFDQEELRRCLEEMA